eukprot:6483328-Amphidinium_carterae.2
MIRKITRCVSHGRTQRIMIFLGGNCSANQKDKEHHPTRHRASKYHSSFFSATFNETLGGQDSKGKH